MLINVSSEMQHEVWEFVRFMTSEESQKMLTLEVPYWPPTLKTLYDDPQVLEAMPVLALDTEAMQNARNRPDSPYYAEISRKMSEQFNNVLRGTTAPEDAVETLQSELQQIIEEGG